MKQTEEIKDLDKRIKGFKAKHHKRTQKSLAEQKTYTNAGFGYQISVELIAAVLLGAAIGYFLDGVFHSKPLCLALFTIFGGAAGFLNIYRAFKNASEKEERR